MFTAPLFPADVLWVLSDIKVGPLPSCHFSFRYLSKDWKIDAGREIEQTRLKVILQSPLGTITKKKNPFRINSDGIL